MSEQMARLEAAHGGRPARDIIVAAINEHGSLSAAARALGVKRDTFYYWVLRLRLDVRRDVVAVAPHDRPARTPRAKEVRLDEVAT